MATNLDLDNDLINEARKLGGHKTKKEAVNEALREYIQHRKQQDVISLFGSIAYEDSYDYKKSRHRK